MNSRQMLINFEDLIRTTHPELEFDITINTDLVYSLLSRAEQEYVVQNFLMGDSIIDNINAIRKNSSVLKNLIKRTTTTTVTSDSIQHDGGYLVNILDSNYWMFLSGTMYHPSLPPDDKGSDRTIVELDLINHYDLQKKVRTTSNEPVYKYIPIVLEGNASFVFYLDKEKYDAMKSSIAKTTFGIVYLATPTGITGTLQPSLAVSTHNDIVKLAVDIFIKEYKFLLGSINKKPNG